MKKIIPNQLSFKSEKEQACYDRLCELYRSGFLRTMDSQERTELINSIMFSVGRTIRLLYNPIKDSRALAYEDSLPSSLENERYDLVCIAKLNLSRETLVAKTPEEIVEYVENEITEQFLFFNSLFNIKDNQRLNMRKQVLPLYFYEESEQFELLADWLHKQNVRETTKNNFGRQVIYDDYGDIQPQFKTSLGTTVEKFYEFIEERHTFRREISTSETESLNSIVSKIKNSAVIKPFSAEEIAVVFKAYLQQRLDIYRKFEEEGIDLKKRRKILRQMKINLENEKVDKQFDEYRESPFRTLLEFFSLTNERVTSYPFFWKVAEPNRRISDLVLPWSDLKEIFLYAKDEILFFFEETKGFGAYFLSESFTLHQSALIAKICGYDGPHYVFDIPDFLSHQNKLKEAKRYGKDNDLTLDLMEDGVEPPIFEADLINPLYMKANRKGVWFHPESIIDFFSIPGTRVHGLDVKTVDSLIHLYEIGFHKDGSGKLLPLLEELKTR